MSIPCLVVPGWGGSGPDHWQSLWQEELRAPCVSLDDWFDPRRAAWVEALDRAVDALARHDSRPPVLVAHSLGCIAVAHWARAAWRAIRAALLVAPADVDGSTCLPLLRDFGPVPRAALPFPSIVIASDNDPYLSVDRADTFARSWGSELRVIHAGGHLNASSGLGRWLEGRGFLSALLQRTDMARTG